ncbi:MAG: penicillin-binding protein activator LpoB [Prevotellaceae bacterium]|jgi:hypothetical protein|nr:penicillin-binding protein activator LpoB [Prevotellaceae bacterium]
MTKKFILCFLALAVTVVAAYSQAKKSVAVVPTLGRAVNDEIKSAIQGALEEGIHKSGSYRLLARGAGFQQALREFKFQQESGAVSDKQLADFGHAAGADYVCYAQINKLSETSYRISYKLVHVKSGEIPVVDSKSVRNGIDGLMDAMDAIADEMFGAPSGGDELTIEKVDEIPAWFLKPQRGEYCGVSLPFKNSDIATQQAIYMALISYMLQHDCKVVLKSYAQFYSDGDGEEHFKSSCKMNLQLPAGYEIGRTAKNKYGEVFVSLRIPQNREGMMAVFATQEATEVEAEWAFQFSNEKNEEIYIAIKEDYDRGNFSVNASEELMSELDLTYTYAATCRRNTDAQSSKLSTEIKLPPGDPLPLEHSLGIACLQAFLGIFESMQRAANTVIRRSGDVSVQTSESTQHKAALINTMCIMNNTLYIDYSLLP